MRRGNYVQADPNLPLVVINQTGSDLVRFNVPASVFPDLHIAGRTKPLIVHVQPTDPGTVPGSMAPNSQASDSTMGIVVPIDTAIAVTAMQGRLTFIDNAVDTTTGTVRLKAELANPYGRLWPGQFAFVSLQLGVDQGVLLVPSQAVELGQKPAVYIVQADGQAVRRPIRLGATVGRLVAVTGGLVEGERVITDGQSRLRPGARVRVVAVDSTTHLATATP